MHASIDNLNNCLNKKPSNIYGRKFHSIYKIPTRCCPS